MIDASLVLAWCFPDENSAAAQNVAEGFQQGNDAIAPSFWPHEVLNALLAGEKRRRISTSQAKSFLGDLAILPIALVYRSSAAVFERVQSLSRAHNLTAYDAAYLDLAMETSLPLATLDAALIRACRAENVSLLT